MGEVRNEDKFWTEDNTWNTLNYIKMDFREGGNKSEVSPCGEHYGPVACCREHDNKQI